MLSVQFRQAGLAITSVSHLLSLCDCAGMSKGVAMNHYCQLITAPPIPRKPKGADAAAARLSQYENIIVPGQQSLYMTSSEVLRWFVCNGVDERRSRPKTAPTQAVCVLSLSLIDSGGMSAVPEAAPTSDPANLQSFPWFAGTMDRTMAEAALQDTPGVLQLMCTHPRWCIPHSRQPNAPRLLVDRQISVQTTRDATHMTVKFVILSLFALATSMAFPSPPSSTPLW